MNNAITDVPGFQVGHAENRKAATGCTVILCPPGTIGGVDVRGSAAGTRQTDSLFSIHFVDEVHAVLLSGGSAFGLDASGGVMRFLEEKSIGYQTSAAKVPIVPTAIIYDLGFGESRVRPDKEMGYQACLNSKSGGVREGSVVYFFGRLGVDPATALSMSLVWFALSVIVSGLGGLAFLVDTRATKRVGD